MRAIYFRVARNASSEEELLERSEGRKSSEYMKKEEVFRRAKALQTYLVIQESPRRIQMTTAVGRVLTYLVWDFFPVSCLEYFIKEFTKDECVIAHEEPFPLISLIISFLQF